MLGQATRKPEQDAAILAMSGGKKRGELQLSLDPADEEAITRLALESEPIRRALAGRRPATGSSR